MDSAGTGTEGELGKKPEECEEPDVSDLPWYGTAKAPLRLGAAFTTPAKLSGSGVASCSTDPRVRKSALIAQTLSAMI